MSINKIAASVLVSLVLVGGIGQVAHAGTVNPAEGKASCEMLGGKWNNNRCTLSNN